MIPLVRAGGGHFDDAKTAVCSDVEILLLEIKTPRHVMSLLGQASRCLAAVKCQGQETLAHLYLVCLSVSSTPCETCNEASKAEASL